VQFGHRLKEPWHGRHTQEPLQNLLRYIEPQAQPARRAPAGWQSPYPIPRSDPASKTLL